MNTYDEDLKEVNLVYCALNRLCEEDVMWESNRVMFVHQYEHKERVVWWRRAQAQAAKGAPAMQTLVAEVIKLKFLE